MKIKNKYVSTIYDMLLELKLGAKDSRIRSRFCRQLQDYFMKVVQLESKEIKTRFAEKDKEGSIIYGENNSFTVPLEYIDEFNQEMYTLDNEFLAIDLNEQNKDMLLTICDILLNNENLEVFGFAALAHEELCDEAEKVLAYYELK